MAIVDDYPTPSPKPEPPSQPSPGCPEAAAAVLQAALQASIDALGERTDAATEEARTAVTAALGRGLLASGEEEGRRRGEQLIAALLRRCPEDADVRCAPPRPS